MSTTDRASRADRIEYLLAELAMGCPEFAPALARVQFEERSAEEITRLARAAGNLGPGEFTVAIMSSAGRGYLATELLDNHPEHAKGIAAHETMHTIAERVASVRDLVGSAWDGDIARANRATDRWINQILCDLSICSVDQVQTWGGLLPPDGMAEADLVELWRAEPKSKCGAKAPKPMGGCGPSGGGGQDGRGEGDQSDNRSASTDAEDLQRDQEAFSTLANMASQSPVLRKMLNPPPPTVRWQDALHEAASCARGAGNSQRPRLTRAKWGRRSTEELPKPGRSSKRPMLVVVVDISGSMSGLLDKVVAEADLVAKGAEVHLVLHDAQVLFSGKYKKGRDRINPAGGTSFAPAMAEAARAAKAWSGQSVVIHLTDGYPCDTWPDVPAEFNAGFAGIFGEPGSEIRGPGRWRTRRCGKVK